MVDGVNIPDVGVEARDEAMLGVYPLVPFMPACTVEGFLAPHAIAADA